MNKKSCRGCRALQEHYDSAGVIHYSCRLGYVIREDEIRHADYKERRPVPTEDCPKPRTWRILYNLPNKASTPTAGNVCQKRSL